MVWRAVEGRKATKMGRSYPAIVRVEVPSEGQPSTLVGISRIGPLRLPQSPRQSFVCFWIAPSSGVHAYYKL